jgi:hypothetical protein
VLFLIKTENFRVRVPRDLRPSGEFVQRKTLRVFPYSVNNGFSGTTPRIMSPQFFLDFTAEP